MGNQAYTDPMDSAENPQMKAAEFWGQVEISTWYAVLEKGYGKIPFDPQQHSPDRRVTAIDMEIFPIVEQDIKYQVLRNMIAESREWAGIVLPSIKALGSTLHEVNKKFVHLRLKATGITYTNKNGETKDKTTFEFVKIFASEAECKADYLSKGGEPSIHNVQSAPASTPQQSTTGTVQTPNQVQPDGTPVNMKEKETARKFLQVLVKKAEGDPTKLTPMIAAYPPVAKFFTVDSPEVTAEILGYLSQQ